VQGPPTGADRCADVCARFNAAPYYGLIGLRADCEAAGTSRVTLAYSEKLTQVYGGIHGGALMSLADASMGIALATLLDDREVAVTVEVSIQLVARPGPSDLVGRGSVVRRGKTLGFVQTSLECEGREVARASSVWHISKR
jgi:uncharacterized protein (TIGR00369 family)